MTGLTLITKNIPAFSPVIFGGLRWHIRNKTGKEPVTPELLSKFGVTRFHYEFTCRLDNTEHTDKSGDKGINLRFNTVITLVNFKKTE